jgi:probable HAF family extracellular repeat protein
MSILRACLPVYSVYLLAALLAGEPAAAQYTITDLGTLGGDMSLATGINNAGQVVGYSGTGGTDPVTRAFLYASPGPMVDIGALGGGNSFAFAINQAGHVVGDSGHAFLYNGTTMIWGHSQDDREVLPSG